MVKFKSRLEGIGERLREARANAEVTQEQLAAAAGVSRPAVSQYEHGAMRPDLEVAERIAHHLGVRAGWLVFGEEPRER